jgi:AcrR family transcriptional regulator
VADEPATERIVEGALRALARHGSRKLSVSDICRESGVSRGTFYRYFEDKDAVLVALGAHLHQAFDDNLKQAIDLVPDLASRVRVVAEVITQIGVDRPEALQIIEVEPRFALEFLRASHPAFLESLRQALRPALRQVEAVQARRMTEMELTELLYRIVLSHYFVPTDHKKLVRQVTRLWESLAKA